MHREIESLIAQFEDVFSGNPWYGDGVIEKLEKMDVKTVAIAPMGKLHSVIQLVRHMTAWKRYLIEKMSGNNTYKIIADSETEWPSQISSEAWGAVVKELKDVHTLLIHDLSQKTVSIQTDGVLDHPIVVHDQHLVVREDHAEEVVVGFLTGVIGVPVLA